MSQSKNSSSCNTSYQKTNFLELTGHPHFEFRRKTDFGGDDSSVGCKTTERRKKPVLQPENCKFKDDDFMSTQQVYIENSGPGVREQTFSGDRPQPVQAACQRNLYARKIQCNSVEQKRDFDTGITEEGPAIVVRDESEFVVSHSDKESPVNENRFSDKVMSIFSIKSSEKDFGAPTPDAPITKPLVLTKKDSNRNFLEVPAKKTPKGYNSRGGSSQNSVNTTAHNDRSSSAAPNPVHSIEIQRALKHLYLLLLYTENFLKRLGGISPTCNFEEMLSKLDEYYTQNSLHLKQTSSLNALRQKFLELTKKLLLVKECITENPLAPNSISKKNSNFSHNLANIVLFDIAEFKKIVRINLPSTLNFDKTEVCTSINQYSSSSNILTTNHNNKRSKSSLPDNVSNQSNNLIADKKRFHKKKGQNFVCPEGLEGPLRETTNFLNMINGKGGRGAGSGFESEKENFDGGNYGRGGLGDGSGIFTAEYI